MRLLSYLRDNRFIVDMFFVVNADVLGVAVNIVASIVLARMLGPEKRGVVAAVLAVPMLIFPLIEMGTRQTAAYFVGKQIALDRDVFRTLGLLLVVLSTIGVTVTIVIGIANGLSARYGWVGLLIASGFIPFNLYFTITKGVLIGKRGLSTIAISTVLIPISYLVMLCVLVLFNQRQVEAALLATVVSTVLGALYISVKFRDYGTLRPAYVPGLPRQILILGLVYALTLFMLSMNYRLDVLILERLSTAEEVGIYTVAVRLAEMLWMVPHALSLVNFSYSASATNPRAQSLRTAKMMRLVLLGALVPGVLIFFLAPWIIPLVYGSEYERSGMVTQAIMPGVWSALVIKILNSDLAGRGRPGIGLWIFTIGVVINVLLCAWWIPDHGAVGASWASSISYTIIGIILAVVYARVVKMRFLELVLLRKSDFGFLTAMFTASASSRN